LIIIDNPVNLKTLYISQSSVFMRPYTMTTDQEVGSSTLSGCATLDHCLSRVLRENKPEYRIYTEVLIFFTLKLLVIKRHFFGCLFLWFDAKSKYRQNFSDESE